MFRVEVPTPMLKQPTKLGDIIASLTSKVGVKPCGGCKDRQEWLNQRYGFRPIAKAQQRIPR